MRTVVLTLSAALLLLVTQPAGASNAVSLGRSDETTIVGPGTDACASGVLIHNHDGSFENGYLWQYTGCQPPYYGAFGEGYDLGEGIVTCGTFWVSTLPGPYIPPGLADCYIWQGGVDGPPGAVILVLPGGGFDNVPVWPNVGQNDVEMNVHQSGPFTVGYWGNWPDGFGLFACVADEDGPRGHPWTCIAPGQGYPSGWQDPAIVWPNAKSMGCGVYFESNPTPAESPTWGVVKSLFW
jgi:hypothetical protein